jgi:excisionase family DNA binding protein
MEPESRDLLTVEQAADYLQLSQSSIRSYIRQGKLKAFRVAGKRKVLIPRDELLKLLEPARADFPDDTATGSNNTGPSGVPRASGK